MRYESNLVTQFPINGRYFRVVNAAAGSGHACAAIG
jgi:hypothetical protein